MIVLKFGGSSLSNATRISAMMDIVKEALTKDRVILVCSAISGCTDYLLNNVDYKPLYDRHIAIIDRLFTGKQHFEAICELDDYFQTLKVVPKDERVTFGELFSTSIIAKRFENEGIATYWIDSRLAIITDSEGKVVESETYRLIQNAIEENSEYQLFVAPGFIASTIYGKVTTLGRGGSDYSAALYAAAINANSLQIWTDVPGIMTANPKYVPSAQTIPCISYEAAFTLAENGAKVLYAPTVQPARMANIAINIRNTFEPENPGTIIYENNGLQQWCAVSSISKTRSKTRVCIVGENINNRKEGENRIINALKNNGISPISKIYGEDSIFYIDVSSLVEKEALKAIHSEFFEDSSPTTIDVYIAGNGAVGKAFVDLINISAKTITQRTGKVIRIAGQSDSKQYVMGSSLQAISNKEGIVTATPRNDGFIEAICAMKPRKAVFVDCTNDERLYLQYEKLFRQGVNIVTSNRRSIAIPYTKYAFLKKVARENACVFRYDTTVGTSLPILESIASSANCSDEIESIEAVVSCTLNKLYSSYNGSESFASLLRKAQEDGLSEKDPRIDIAGKDVLRKLLILAREAGVALEQKDVKIKPLLSKDFFDCSLDEFYSRLEAKEEEFTTKYAKMKKENLRQRFLAVLSKDTSSKLGYKAEIKMINVGVESPFYWISDTENVIIINSSHSAPLIIKGAGEGAKQAAIGIIKDILM